MLYASMRLSNPIKAASKHVSRTQHLDAAQVRLGEETSLAAAACHKAGCLLACVAFSADCRHPTQWAGAQFIQVC